MVRPLRIEFEGAVYHILSHYESGQPETGHFPHQDGPNRVPLAFRRDRRPFQMDMSSLLPDGQPLPPASRDTPGKLVERHAPAEQRLHAGL